MYMAKLTKTNTQEHVLNRDEAERYLTNRISQDESFGAVATEKIQSYDSPYLNNDTVAEGVLDGISGVSGDFSQYTSESIDRMSPEYFGKLIDYQHTEIQGVRDEMATATMAVVDDTMNDGIYTTDELLRSNEYASENYSETVHYAFEAETKSPEELKAILGDDFELKTHDTVYDNFDRLEQMRDVHNVSGLNADDLGDLNMEDSKQLKFNI